MRASALKESQSSRRIRLTLAPKYRSPPLSISRHITTWGVNIAVDEPATKRLQDWVQCGSGYRASWDLKCVPDTPHDA